MIRAVGFGRAVLVGAGVLLLTVPAWAAYSSPAAPGTHQAAAPQGYLGVDLKDITEDQVAALKQKDTRGAEVVLVDHDAPAGKAGLREHDIVLRINGQGVAGQDAARRMLHDLAPGAAVVLYVSREGRLLTISAAMSTREEVERRAWAQHIAVPEPQDASEAATSVAAALSPAPAVRAGNSFIGSILMNSSYTGAMLEQLNKQLAVFFGAPTGTGLLVRSVAENSPAAAAGLRVGDVIVRANEKALASNGDWAKAIKSSHGRPIAVVVLREKKEQTLTLTPDGHHRSSLEELIVSPQRTLVAHLGRSWLGRS